MSSLCRDDPQPKMRNYDNHIYSNGGEDDILANIPIFVLELNERSESKPSTSHSKAVYHDPDPGTTSEFTIGSLVEVSNDVSEEPLYGVIRWMGVEEQARFVLVGVELEEEQSHLPLTLTDGTHNGERFFRCAENRALFVPLGQCRRDSRFQDGAPAPVHQVSEKVFDKVCGGCEGRAAGLSSGFWFFRSVRSSRDRLRRCVCPRRRMSRRCAGSSGGYRVITIRVI